jgi:predicted nucleic acid-binding protein
VTQVPEVVYIDTMVFAFRLLPNPNYGKSANQSTSFFDDLDAGRYRGITSTFTRIEYSGIVKRVVSYLKKREASPIEEQIALNDFQQFVDGLQIDLSDADTLAYHNLKSTLFYATAETLRTTKPFFHKEASERHQWKNIGGADALQINLAIRSGAKRFATFDRGFKGLNNPSITPLIIQEEYL